MSPTWITKASGSASRLAIIETNFRSSAAVYGVSPMTAKANAGGCGERVAQPASASRRTAASALPAGELLERIERFQRFARAHRVRLEVGERFAQRIGRGRFGRGRRREEVGLPGIVAQLAFQLGEMAARRAHDLARNARQVRDVDPVGAVRGPAFQPVEEDDAILVLDRVEV